MGNIEKGKRAPTDPTVISPDEMREYLAEMKRRPGTPIPCLQEDAAAVQGLIDILIVKGIIKDEHPDEVIVQYMDHYNSIVTGLVMLLIDKNVITEKEMDAAILAFHHAIRHFGNGPASFEEVSTLRRDTLKKRLGR
jgi:hypothetical protein